MSPCVRVLEGQNRSLLRNQTTFYWVWPDQHLTECVNT